MNAPLKGTGLVFAAAGAALIKKALDQPPGGWAAPGPVDSQRWRVVTVNLPIDAVKDMPEPLADLGDAIEVRISPAPGDKGTEIAARLRSPGEPTDPSIGAVREALRDAKQLLEVGWVLEPDRNRTSRPTPFNAPLRWATSAARRLGRL